jgi:hypothetical protein
MDISQMMARAAFTVPSVQAHCLVLIIGTKRYLSDQGLDLDAYIKWHTPRKIETKLEGR